MAAAQATEEDRDLDDPDYKGGKNAEDEEKGDSESRAERDPEQPGQAAAEKILKAQ